MCETTNRGTICTPGRLSEGEIAEYEKLDQERTQGEWTAAGCDELGYCIALRAEESIEVICHAWPNSPANARFIAASSVAIPALIAEVRARGREIEGLRDQSCTQMLKAQAAEDLADECTAQVILGHLDSRSAIGDALLDYRDPPRTERSDRIAEMQLELDRLQADAELGRMCREWLKTPGHSLFHDWHDKRYFATTERHPEAPDDGETIEECLTSALAALQAAQEAHDE